MPGVHRWTPLLAVTLTLAGCKDSRPRAGEPTASEQDAPPRERHAELGFSATDPSLPLLVHDDTGWRPEVSSDVAEVSALRGRRVRLSGKMVLGGSAPRRAAFMLLPGYDGCVAAEHPGDAYDAVEIVLSPGQTLQVTDARLRIDGVLRLVATGGGPPRLRLDDAHVALDRPVLDASN